MTARSLLEILHTIRRHRRDFVRCIFRSAEFAAEWAPLRRSRCRMPRTAAMPYRRLPMA